MKSAVKQNKQNKQHQQKKQNTQSAIVHNMKSTSDPIPDEKAVQDILANLDVIPGVLGTYAASLTTVERRRQLKVRRGGDRYMIAVAELGSRYGLQIPGVSVESMQTRLTLMTRIEPLAARLRALSEVVNDTLLRNRSDAWQGTTAMYTMLSRMSQQIPAIRAELEPIAALFVNAKPGMGKRQPKKSKSQNATTTTPAVPEATPVVASPKPATPVVQPVTNGASAPPTSPAN